MAEAAHRDFKSSLYGHFASLGKALASPIRIECLELLAQGERTVDSLAAETGISLANASQHLQVLRRAALVESRQSVPNEVYVLPGETVLNLGDPAV